MVSVMVVRATIAQGRLIDYYHLGSSWSGEASHVVAVTNLASASGLHGLHHVTLGAQLCIYSLSDPKATK
jgi:hypothetical protein